MIPTPTLPSLLVGFSTTKVYSGIGADIVMESITLVENWKFGSMSAMAILHRWTLPNSELNLRVACPQAGL
jgi:hypothetical protein